VLDSSPLFSVSSPLGFKPTYKQFCSFLFKVVSWLQLNPAPFSPYSFCRGGTTFPFDCPIPSEVIKLQVDWHSDAYLV